MSRFLLIEILNENKVKIVAPVDCVTDGSTYYANLVSTLPPWQAVALALPETVVPHPADPDDQSVFGLGNLPTVIKAYTAALDNGSSVTSVLTAEDRLNVFTWTRRLATLDWPMLHLNSDIRFVQTLASDWINAELDPYVKWLIYQNLSKKYDKTIEELQAYCKSNDLRVTLENFTSARASYATIAEPPFKWIINKFFSYPVEDGPDRLSCFDDLIDTTI